MLAEGPCASTPAHSPQGPTRSNPGSTVLRRYTLDGDDELELQLDKTCARITSGVRGLIPALKLEAVLLGGGYGRGEGGVLSGRSGDRPYNDLECFVAIRGHRHVNEFRYHRRLDVLGEILTHLADVEVEFKITSLSEMASRPPGMFLYDLASGHRLLWSNPTADPEASLASHRNPGDILQEDATRLLMNRCSGLLFASALLAKGPFTPSVADFVGRNIAKAQLAFGDALLAANGRYHWSCRERHRRLADLAQAKHSPWLDGVLRHHAVGLEFKLRPQTVALSHGEPIARHSEVTAFALKCWLWLETRRLGRVFPTAKAYADDHGNKCPGTSPFQNVVLNLRADVLRLHAVARPWRHPRQRVLESLALLLWEPGSTDDPIQRRRIRARLAIHGSGTVDWVTAYRALWARVR